jgi:mRNA interferase RelE/StbE
VSELPYIVSLRKSAQREIKSLDHPVRSRVVKALRLLQDPRPPGCLKLAGSNNLWRIRVGDWRILYEISDDDREVNIRRAASQPGLRLTHSPTHPALIHSYR